MGFSQSPLSGYLYTDQHSFIGIIKQCSQELTIPTYNEALWNYILQTFANEDDVLLRIRQGTANNGLPQINIQSEEGHFLQFLVASNGAKRVLEIGTLGGYSGTWIARGLPHDGKLITIEKDPRHAEVARSHFQLEGVPEKVDVREGEARKLLQDLSREGPFNLIFIDAEFEFFIQRGCIFILRMLLASI